MQLFGCFAVLRDEGRECFGPMETEYRTAARLGIEAVREPRFYAGALVEKWKRAPVRREFSRQALAILGSLHFDTDQGKAFFLGFDDAGCLAVHIEEIVREAVSAREGKISEDHASPGMKICILVVLYSPACLLQRLVDVCAGFIFGGRHGAQNSRFRAFDHPAFLRGEMAGYIRRVRK